MFYCILQVVSENTERADMLAQINDLEAALKDRDERIMGKRLVY